MSASSDTVPSRQPAAAGHVLLAAVSGLVLAAFLNAPSLLETARRLPIGVERTVAMGVMRPVAAASGALRLDRPRLWIEQALGREEPLELPLVIDVPVRHGSVDTTLPAVGPSDPADVWIVGDSLVELLGPHLTDILDDTESFDVDFEFRYISGLMRPDFFDWPDRIAEKMKDDPPDIIVVMFGGNDGQNVTVDGTPYTAFTPTWFRLYRSRVAEAMDAMRGDNMRAYWLGLPIMKSETFSGHARDMNVVYAEEASERGWMSYVDTWDVFADRSGRYADYLPNPNGDLRLMRYEDGVHFTPSGARRLAHHVFEVIERDWGL